MQLEATHEPPRIRATQGHSIHLEAPILLPVTSAEDVVVAMHITSPEALKVIQEDGFLRKMGRTHVHFATSPNLGRKNTWATCFLQLRIADALSDGIPLFRSTNGVLLCEGPLPVKYVDIVAGWDSVPPSACPLRDEPTPGQDGILDERDPAAQDSGRPDVQDPSDPANKRHRAG